jgi:Sec-independent protein translocase protein TatA
MIVFFIFGAKRLPEMGKGLGRPFGGSKREWKKNHRQKGLGNTILPSSWPKMTPELTA